MLLQRPTTGFAIAGMASIAMSVSSPALAVNLSFTGGTYAITGTAAGFSLVNFVNKTKTKVNDLHVKINYVNNFDEAKSLSHDFFFPDLAPNGVYTPPTITPDSNVTVGFGPLGVNDRWNFDENTLKDGGTYWTKDKDPVVPGPLPVLGIGFAYGYARRLRRLCVDGRH
jgi:hypothetical protein